MTIKLLSLVLLSILARTSNCSKGQKWPSYTYSAPVFHVLWSEDERDVIVGARNAILKFDDDLSLVMSARTGPSLDHPQCPPVPLPCDHQRQTTDNDVKVMLFFDQHVMLVCGTVRQGMCHLYNNNNVTGRAVPIGYANETSNYVAGRSSVVAFFAENHNGDTALYTASSYDGRPSDLTEYSISSRIFVMGNQGNSKIPAFDYSHSSDYTVSAVSVHPQFRNYVNYVYGFNHNVFNYFLLTQRKGEQTYETRLARICQDDPNFFSYSEVTLRCLKESALVYNIATAAYLGDISRTLRIARGVENEEKVLYVAFGQNAHGSAPIEEQGSVLCMFPMTQIESAFINATRDCFDGGPGARRIKTILGTDTKCEKKELLDHEALLEAQCNPGLNHYIEGRIPVPGGVKAVIQELVTSLAIAVQKDYTIAFVGTKNGRLVKVVLEQGQVKSQMYKVPLDPNPNATRFEVRASSAFDESQNHLYLLTGNTVVKFPVGSCSPHPSCKSCVSSKDPLGCGWCGDRCSTKDECPEGTFKKDQCPPFIFQISPNAGHRDGGTLVTIDGDNFGTDTDNSNRKYNITVVDVDCTVVSWSYKRIVCQTGAMKGVAVGPVVIQLEDTSYLHGLDINGTAVSEANFTYTLPKLLDVSPRYGVLSGGTRVTIVGELLDIGSNRSVTLAGAYCRITRYNSSHIHCESKPSPKRLKGAILAHVDGNIVPVEGMPDADYEYRPDPVVLNIVPNATSWSGGTDLIIYGRNLDSSSDPRMVVTVTHTVSARQYVVEQRCTPGDSPGSTLVCRTPSLQGVAEDSEQPTSSVPIRAHISFLMDGVLSLRNFSRENVLLSQLLYHPDPIFYPFHKNVSQVRIDTMELYIKGENLNLSLRPEDVVVAVNSSLRCNVTRLTFDTLTCTLPTHLNSSAVYNSVASSPIPVVVRAGNQEFHVGGFVLVQPPESLSGGLMAGIALGVSVLLAALFIFLYKRGVLKKLPYFKKFRKNQYTAAYTAEPAFRNEYQEYPSGSGPCDNEGAKCSTGQIVSEETMHLLTAENILIARDYLALGDEIGHGNFGRVYEGQLQLPGVDETKQVAVKTLHNCHNLDPESVESFLQEGLMMKDFHHPHVLTQIGVCFEDSGLPMVILPFMKHGDLRSYIQDENNEPTIKMLIECGIQVAEGMKYLSELKFVHRDLAARNCMLDENLVVKVADFGLSRDVYERDYYSSDNKKSKLPVKWMAPESLEKGTYSTKSDVWSFGVLLWELMTRGVTPYPEVGNWEILTYIKTGRRMLQPSYCPNMLYKIMLRCWSDDPRSRPTFGDLAKEIKSIIKEMEDKNKKVGLNVTYVNVPNTAEEEKQPFLESV